MALLIDGEINRIDDLKKYDSSVLEVAAVEGIDLTAKLELAREALLSDVRTALGRSPAGYQAEQAAATPDLTRMHAYTALELVYRDAYFSQLNDRYGSRWREYQREARSAWEKVRANGIGVVANPLARALPPAVNITEGSLDAATYYVMTSWVRADGAEGEASEAVTASGPIGHGVQAAPAAAPAGATGWNVYAGYTPAAMQKQNQTPLEAGAVWTLTAGTLAAGAAPGRGQAPDLYYKPERGLCRG
jgi:hypothetical protein